MEDLKPKLPDEVLAAIDAEVERLLGPRVTELVEEQPGEPRAAYGAEEQFERTTPNRYG